MRSALAAALSAVLFVTLLVRPAHAAPAYQPPTPQRDWVTPSTVVGANGATSLPAAPTRAAAVVWPKAAVAEAQLPSARDRKQLDQDSTVAFAGTPVRIAASGSIGRARVRMLDRAQTQAAGLRGVVFGVSRADGVSTNETVRVTLDYRDFAAAYGADWALRLRLVRVPACALSTPDRDECRVVPLPSSNDRRSTTVSAAVPVSATETLVAAEAGPSSGAGDYGATSLQPSATWTAGSSTGEFTWAYPLRTPPGVGGPSPKLELSYSSGNVDGRMAASNNQPSWVGEGFELWPGYIERRYKSCGEDMGTGANNATKTGDQCWVTDNATLSLAGHAGELLKDATTTDRWHLRGDDGTYVQRRTGADNGDDNGEWWVVTTTDGTQYWFGGRSASNATWTVPVAGNHPGEPGNSSTFEGSFKTQAWRWNLDHVVDQHGNTMSYVYVKETNKYAKAGKANNATQYDRGGYLARIDYGTRTGATGNAPVVVEFTPSERCFTTSCGAHTPQNWSDVPWDLECTGNPCYTGAPTFWSTKRLASVTTKLYTGNGDTYTPVTTWAFTHSTPDPGDGTRGGLRLDKVSQTGQVRVSTPVPDVTFAYVQLNNRVDPALTPDHSPPMNWFRIAQITSETGGRTEVTYSAPDCIPGSRMPDVNALQDNGLRCYPVRWTPPGYTRPIWDFFHKYVVTEVHEVDTVTPGNPTTVTKYEHVGSPAWHYTDDDGLVKAEDKTWSVWRGYAAVRTRQGVGAGQTLNEIRYFRGMHGDKLPSGNRSVTMPAVDMNRDGDTTDPVDVPAMNDEDAFAGMPRESIVFNGSGGGEVSAEVSVAWQSEPTASRTINNVTIHARHTGVSETHTRLARDGGRAPRTTSTVTTFDGFGLPIEQEDRGDEAVAEDDKCTLTTYARNVDLTDGDEWLVALVGRKQQFAVGCTRAKQSGLGRDEVIADERSHYDLASGLLTGTETLEDWVNGAPVFMTASTSEYDSYGRPTRSTDSKGNVTVTTYTHNAGGQLSGKSMRNAKDWTSTQVIEPAFGLPLRDTDPNGRATSIEYDGVGRTTALWRPGRDQGTQSPHERYEYTVRNNAPTVVTTSKLLPSGSYATSYELHDGLLRLRQTQAPRGDGTAGVLVSDVFYDTAGREWKKYPRYLTAGSPGTLLIVPNEQAHVPERLESTYDGAGRTIVAVRYIRNPDTGVVEEHSRESTVYGGDRVDRTPPTGGVATSTFTDTRGNTTALRQYHGPTPTPTIAGSYDETRYEYTAKDQLARVTDNAGKVWTNTYDLRGQKETSTDPNSGTITTKHNKYGELEWTLDARDVRLVYTYDELGRKKSRYLGSVSPANERARWEYDTLPNSRGQLTRSTRFEDGNAYVREVLGFTATYQPTGVRFTVPASETGLAGSYAYFYTYYPDGSPETVRLPDVDGTAGGMAGETLRYEYTPLGHPDKLRTNLDGGTTYVAGTAYTGYGERATITLQHNAGSTVTLANTYAEGTRRLVRALTSRQTSPSDVADLRYEYDAAGSITKMSDVVSGDHQCFRYDYALRLKQAWTPGGGDCRADPTVEALGGPARYWTTWDFDVAGNRAKQVEHVTSAGPRTTTYQHPDEPHRLKSSKIEDGTGTVTRQWTYEPGGYVRSRPNGTGTQELTWDAEGHLATVDTNTSYAYDADGERIIRRDPTGKTLYLPNQELRQASGGAKSTIRYYAHAGSTVATRTTDGVTWLSADHQGTVSVTIGATTQSAAIRRQDPFGNERTGSGTWPSSMDKGFVGGTKDGTGLTHLGAREYDPVTGRFVSPDPLVDYANPQHLDCYNYGFQNPIAFADPDGRASDPTGKFDYVWVHSETSTYTKNGYRYTVRVDFYVACRNSGTECWVSWSRDGLGYSDWVSTWLIFLFPGFFKFKIYAASSVTRVKDKVAGPQRPEQIKKNNVKAAPYCLQAIKPPDDTCDFFDFACAQEEGWHKWWKGNKDWVMGAALVASVLVCPFTAGLSCEIGLGLAIPISGRVFDLGTEIKENGQVGPTQTQKWQFALGVGIDVGLYHAGKPIPSIRQGDDGFRLNPRGIAAQAAWAGFQWPATPWSDIFDPFKWTFLE